MTHPLPDRPPPYGTVVFDCDSTLAAVEGIEELAGERRGEIEAWTARAMAGELPLEAVFARRLERIRPGAGDLARAARRYRETALPRAGELIAHLTALGKRVHVVSGGLLPAVRPFAVELGIPPEHVHAVDLHLDARGAYAGFDEQSPLARSGGKREVIAGIAAEPGAGPVVLVGDGATDLEAADLVARFVAFGGFAARPAVLAAARVRVLAADAAALVPHLFSREERAALPAHLRPSAH